MRGRKLYSLEILEKRMFYLFVVDSMRDKLRSPRDLTVSKNSLHAKEDFFLNLCWGGGNNEMKQVKQGTPFLLSLWIICIKFTLKLTCYTLPAITVEILMHFEVYHDKIHGVSQFLVETNEESDLCMAEGTVQRDSSHRVGIQ